MPIDEKEEFDEESQISLWETDKRNSNFISTSMQKASPLDNNENKKVYSNPNNYTRNKQVKALVNDPILDSEPGFLKQTRSNKVLEEEHGHIPKFHQEKEDMVLNSINRIPKNVSYVGHRKNKGINIIEDDSVKIEHIMNDLSFLMEHMDEKDKTVARDLHLTNSMSNLYNNTANLIGSFTEGHNTNISNLSNINQSNDLILNGSIIPSHLKKELIQKDFLQTKSGEKVPPEIITMATISKKEEETGQVSTQTQRKSKHIRNHHTNSKEMDSLVINKVLKSLDDDDEKQHF